MAKKIPPLTQVQTFYVDGNPEKSDEVLASEMGVDAQAVTRYREEARAAAPRSRTDAAFHRTTAGGKEGGCIAMTPEAAALDNDFNKNVAPPDNFNADKWHRIR